MTKIAGTLPTKLFWVDLEMTGLDSNEDLILEIAAIITDFNFKELSRYVARVTYDRAVVVERMERNIWWENVPENRDEFIARLSEGKPLAVVEQEIIAFLHEQFGNEPVILAGNSIHQDRKFIVRWWPALNAKMHYRMLDVSSLKIYMQGKYGVEFEKKSTHRALDDIKESMVEWQYYMEQLRKLQG
jgi:oligoribonuclease